MAHLPHMDATWGILMLKSMPIIDHNWLGLSIFFV